jgi:N-acetylglutamate synthase
VDAQRLEQLAARAWPALVADDLDGWVVRRAAGFTKRANSVWPRADGGRPLEEKLAEVERVYAAEGLPACYFIGSCVEPAGLDDALAARGYVVADQSLVLAAPLAAGREPTHAPNGLAVTLLAAPDATWLATWRTAAAVGEADARVALQLFGAAGTPTAYALATDTVTGRPVATGRGVLQDGAVGIFNMATVHAQRGCGAGAAVLDALMSHGATAGATTAYLQVSAANAVARRLYDRAGFAEAASYRYRVQPR